MFYIFTNLKQRTVPLDYFFKLNINFKVNFIEYCFLLDDYKNKQVKA